MKNISLYLLLAVSLGLSPLAGAATISGAGGKTCGAFMEGVKLKSDVAINGFISWAQGFQLVEREGPECARRSRRAELLADRLLRRQSIYAVL